MYIGPLLILFWAVACISDGFLLDELVFRNEGIVNKDYQFWSKNTSIFYMESDEAYWNWGWSQFIMQNDSQTTKIPPVGIRSSVPLGK